MSMNMMINKEKQLEGFEVKLRIIGAGLIMATKQGNRKMIPAIEKEFTALQKDFLPVIKASTAKDQDVLCFCERLIKLDGLFNQLKQG